jgi:predicted ATPase
MSVALAAHDALLRRCVTDAGGDVFKHTGDGCVAVFPTARSAVTAAVIAQRALNVDPIGGPNIGTLAIRVGIHTGPAAERDGDWFGPTLNRAARISAAAHGGQVVVSEVTASLSADAAVELRDLGQHQLRDLPRPERLYQVVADGLPDEFPVLRTAPLASALPRPRGAFIGREELVAELVAALSTERLTTLTGVGGVGKTRLALAVAAAAAPMFADGAFFVELAPVTDQDLVVRAVADATGMPPIGGSSPIDDLTRFLQAKTMLLVVDNCEHLLDACADLIDEVSARCPNVRFLLTSREAVGADGERAWHVPSLGRPDPSSPELSAAELLFNDRARSARNDFAPNATDRRAIAEICTRLDGIPLAIELAASRVRHFPPPQLLELLHDRFRLLTGGRRRSQQRHQTLQATMDWSHDLLPEPEQILLRRLAVFTGGFDLDAAEGICGDVDDSVLPALASLVDKSLVEFDEQDSSARYRLLETVRLYARQKLVDAAEADAFQSAHRDWYLNWATNTGTFDPSGAVALRREDENLRAALEWSDEQANSTLVAQLVAAMCPLWMYDMRTQEGLGWLEGDAVAAGDPHLGLEGRVAWRAVAAMLHNALMDISAGARFSREADELDPAGETGFAFQARFAEAQVRSFFDPHEALAILNRPCRHTPFSAAVFEFSRGVIHFMAREFDEGMISVNAAIQSPHIDPYFRTWALLCRSMGCGLTGRPAEALSSVMETAGDLAVSALWQQDVSRTTALCVAYAGVGDLPAAREALLTTVELTETRYPHLPGSAGLPAVAATVVLEADGRAAVACDLLEDIVASLMHARWEMTYVLANANLHRLRETFGSDASGRPRRTSDDLLAAARRVAQGELPT